MRTNHLPSIVQLFAMPMSGVAVRLARLFLSVAICWLIAGVFWKIMEPEQKVPLISAPDLNPGVLVEKIVSAELFKPRGTNSIAEHPQFSGENIIVRGLVVDKAARRSFAIISINNQPNLVANEGTEIAPGVRLERILSNKIEIVSASGRQTVLLAK